MARDELIVLSAFMAVAVAEEAQFYARGEAAEHADFRAQPCDSAASRALIAAMRAESRRFICPAPIPAVTPSLA